MTRESACCPRCGFETRDMTEYHSRGHGPDCKRQRARDQEDKPT
jgi:predicted Zn-ribbon and HTH transcriptional regulator